MKSRSAKIAKTRAGSLQPIRRRRRRRGGGGEEENEEDGTRFTIATPASVITAQIRWVNPFVGGGGLYYCDVHISSSKGSEVLAHVLEVAYTGVTVGL